MTNPFDEASQGALPKGCLVGCGALCVAAFLLLGGMFVVGRWLPGGFSCEDQAPKVRALSEPVRQELSGLPMASVTAVAYCDSGDAPYLDVSLSRVMEPSDVVRYLERTGWRHEAASERVQPFADRVLHKSVADRPCRAVVSKHGNNSATHVEVTLR
ncbi:hypothetical protein [Actinomadura oligospora]|uniref:hypothetical protein n=1 Tax=Actinomadura oligospora TaxID=111804 RepID=UPI0004AE3EB8|nr:hypothetical protein [Actinomadura oligospora]